LDLVPLLGRQTAPRDREARELRLGQERQDLPVAAAKLEPPQEVELGDGPGLQHARLVGTLDQPPARLELLSPLPQRVRPRRPSSPVPGGGLPRLRARGQERLLEAGPDQIAAPGESLRALTRTCSRTPTFPKSWSTAA